jgi:UDP-3-O-[3-hydroxymyristoyl] glucosamine N-acyltransferase
MRFQLQDWLPHSNIRNRGGFEYFGGAEAARSGALAYCDTYHHLTRALANERVSAVIVDESLADSLPGDCDKAVALVPSARDAYWHVFTQMAKAGLQDEPIGEGGRDEGCEVHPTAVIDAGVRLGRGVKIGPFAVIERNSVIHAYCEIHAHAIVGSTGLQTYVWEGRRCLVPHCGDVRLGEGVAVLTGANISRAARPLSTIVSDFAMISIQASVSHGVVVGARSQLAGKCIIGGSARIGEDVFVGIGAVVRDGVRIGDGARVSLGSVVVEDVKAGQIVSGNFAISHELYLRRFFEAKRSKRGC